MMSTTEVHLPTVLPAELERLHNALGSGLSEAQMAQTRATLNQLYTAPLVFQPRIEKESPWVKARHVKSLATAAKQRGTDGLAPILVLPVGGTRIVVDGHCRLKAYWARDPTGRTTVPVRFLRDTTVRDALFISSEANSRDKLPLSSAEKAERAWFLVRTEEGRPHPKSVRAIEAATGCSKSLVWTMQKLLAKHPRPTEGNADAFNPREMPWTRAKLGKRTEEEFDVETWREKWITTVSTKLRKTLGDRPDRQPELFHEALRRAYPCIAKDIDDEYAAAREEAEANTEGETHAF